MNAEGNIVWYGMLQNYYFGFQYIHIIKLKLISVLF